MASYRAGANMDIRIIHAGGTIVVTTKYRTLSYEENGNLIDQTAGNDTFKSFILGIVDGKISLECTNNGTATPMGTADLATLTKGLQGTIYLSPHGTATGMIKYGGACIIDNRKLTWPYDDLATVSWDISSNGAWADASW